MHFEDLVGDRNLMLKRTRYSTFQICELFGIARPRLQEWIVRGYIKPSIQKSVSRGTKNVLSKNDLYKLKIFDIFFRFGMSRRTLGVFLDVFRYKSAEDIIEAGHKYLIWFGPQMEKYISDPLMDNEVERSVYLEIITSAMEDRNRV